MSDYKMTPEIRKALLSKVPFNKDATIEYTPRCFLTKTKGSYDLPEEFRPIFTVRTLSKADAKLASKLKLDPNDDDSDTKLRDITRRCIVSWRRLYDAGARDGDDIVEIAHSNGADGYTEMSLFDLLPPHVIADIYIYTTGISGLRILDRAGL